jgi:hypothetical protein
MLKWRSNVSVEILERLINSLQVSFAEFFGSKEFKSNLMSIDNIRQFIRGKAEQFGAKT